MDFYGFYHLDRFSKSLFEQKNTNLVGNLSGITICFTTIWGNKTASSRWVDSSQIPVSSTLQGSMAAAPKPIPAFAAQSDLGVLGSTVVGSVGSLLGIRCRSTGGPGCPIWKPFFRIWGESLYFFLPFRQLPMILATLPLVRVQGLRFPQVAENKKWRFDLYRNSRHLTMTNENYPFSYVQSCSVTAEPQSWVHRTALRTRGDRRRDAASGFRRTKRCTDRHSCLSCGHARLEQGCCENGMSSNFAGQSDVGGTPKVEWFDHCWQPNRHTLSIAARWWRA